MTTQAALLNALSRHQGKEAGVSAERLAAELGVNVRKLRRLVTTARADGIAICGRPESGYFVPTTPEELSESCEFLEHRAKTSLLLLSRMKQVSLPELLGQLKLNQA